jgi:phosphatidylglycerophosphate synthase
MNAIDGMLAREFGQKSDLGAYLNELTDVISDVFLYLPFAYLGIFDPLWIGITIVLAVISEMAGTIGVMIGAPAATTARWARVIARSSSERGRCGSEWAEQSSRQWRGLSPGCWRSYWSLQSSIG